MMNAEFLVVAHRLPMKVENRSLIPTDGGLASALRSAHLEGKAEWVGCLGENPDCEFIEKLPKHCSHVSIEEKVFRNFYNGYSNSVLWPAFHNRIDLIQYNDDEWSAYFEANNLFAQKIVNKPGPMLPVWVHDYQLMMVPLLVKLHQPRRRVSFFLHIPWPELSVARKIPRLTEIARSLSKCDQICVHTEEYKNNLQAFFDDVNLGTPKKLPIEVLPIGIAPEEFSTEGMQDKTSLPLKWAGLDICWKKQNPDVLNIIGVDRLDYSKGLDLKIQVFAEFLELHPEWRGRICLRQLLIPSREDVVAYKAHKEEVLSLVAYTNQKFGTDTWKPIDLFFGRTDSENLKKIYRCGDFCWITSKKDGMNLVALEYVAAQAPLNPGLLILSDKTGSAQHLQGALLYKGDSDISALKGLNQALNMEDSEKRVRYKRDIQWIKTHSVSTWVKKNLEFLLPTANSPTPIKHELFSKDQNPALRQ